MALFRIPRVAEEIFDGFFSDTTWFLEGISGFVAAACCHWGRSLLRLTVFVLC